MILLSLPIRVSPHDLMRHGFWRYGWLEGGFGGWGLLGCSWRPSLLILEWDLEQACAMGFCVLDCEVSPHHGHRIDWLLFFLAF
jgi:hypothetical protein